ncbi:hypothetical protein JCM19240_451 [Vibrio maritimus]|uniref:Uncharacterized protein n=1 Tax=Vibrio maritimus TaxID=990268 RepID=A0A090TA57_9VIBR|nr:hypothetical protein JCM19240_451 [Vibrio maritimus]
MSAPLKLVKNWYDSMLWYRYQQWVMIISSRQSQAEKLLVFWIE